MKRHISMILVAVLLTVVLVGCGGGDAGYTDGTYTGEGKGINPLEVSVTITDGKISNVEVTNHKETPGYFEPAFEQLPDAIVAKNSTDVDAVTGATATSNGIKEAVDKALEKAE